MGQSAIGEAQAVRPMSIEAWAALPEDEPGELVDGWVVEKVGQE